MITSRRSFSLSGFTLLELLVVIAIILILVAIALPAFLNSQVRANVVRCTSELRSISQSLERYYSDFRFYPLRTTPQGETWPSGLNNLTTPIPYMTPARLRDRFPEDRLYIYYRYWPIRPDGFVQNNTNPHNKDSNWYLVSSNGPDCDFNPFAATLRGHGSFAGTVYAPTNGTRSPGNVWRLGGSPDGVGKPHVVPFLPPSSRN
jgi:prepilin-type N-terminal cleavage/methylation domain-containing protein